MEIFPDAAGFARLAEQGNLVPVWTDLLADSETPLTVYSRLRTDGPAFLLESIEGGERLSRYSFLGARPRKTFIAGPQVTTIRHADGRSETIPTPPDPLSLVQAEIAACRPVLPPGMAPFEGGAVGFISHEYVSRIEPTVPAAANPTPDPLLYFMMADTLVVFDRARQTLRLCVLARIGGDAVSAYEAAVRELRSLFELISRPVTLEAAPFSPAPPVRPPPGNFTRTAYEDAVAGAKEFIRAGDIIQVVLSQRFEEPFDRTPLELYRTLRTVNPSPYMVLLEDRDFAVVGASPEVHVRLTGRTVEIRPIAGTRPRGSTPEEDGAREKELLADEKERAEHLMLVDLARNDIGRVCEYGSVRVPEFMIVERYSHVMHIVSQVEGRLRPDADAFDLMRATFPAGTLSGAPKVRALQIIATREADQRGIYGGAIGYFSYGGNLDSCIAIRTAVLRDGRLRVQAGAGIVADSAPAAEFQETVDKAQGLLRAAALARRLPRRD